MGEGLLARARRVVEAGVGSVVETAERLSSPSLMRQAVRDAEHAVDDARRQQDRAQRLSVEAGEVARLADERAARMESDAREAIALGRDDLATAALTQKQAAQADAVAARATQAAAAAEAAQLSSAVVELAARHRRLGDKLHAHELAVRVADLAVSPALDRKIAHAEQSFARAMSAVGGSDRASRDAALGVEELEQVRRDRAIGDELARLKAETGAPARRARRN